ncbi:MAG: hypothetical protein KOO62_01900 [candidate division Zixibacteria bacterium]|nr:hypothetical protein [candidate division Zixibacteria bacterium]
MKINFGYSFFLILLLMFCGSVVTADPTTEASAIFRSPSCPPVGTFDNFRVQATDSIVGHLAGYSFSFLMDRADFKKLNGGAFAFSFPEGYDLSAVVTATLTHNSIAADYRIKAVETTDDMVVVILKKSGWQPPDEVPPTVSIGVYLEIVGNPQVVGDYMFGGLAMRNGGSVLAGPAISDPLEIRSGAPVSLDVEPSDNQVLRAGESIVFNAVVRDSQGGLIPSPDVYWTLEEGSDPIGYFSGAMLHVTTVGEGRVMARVGNVTGLSGMISVLPGALARFELDISPEQIVGYPLLPEASLILLDAFDNLKIDYDLTTNPVYLSTNVGNLAPAVIDNAGLLFEGVVDLDAIGIVYTGPTVVTTVTVETDDGLVSSGQVVSFSGYDILEVLNADNAPLISIAPTIGTLVKVVVTNNGYNTPQTSTVSLALTSGLTASVGFAAGANGLVDTVEILLAGPRSELFEDNLTVVLEADFNVDGMMFTTTNQVELTVVVVEPIEPVELEVVPGLFWPDSLYPGITSEISLDIHAVDPPDFTIGPTMRVALTSDGGATEVFLTETSGFSHVTGVVISHEHVSVLVPGVDLLPSGWYDVVLDYAYVSAGVPYLITHKIIDSVFVLTEIEVTYVEGSFGPAMVSAGRESSFGFTVNLDGEYSVPVDPSGAIIEIHGKDFLSAALLRIADMTLYPGLNLVTTDPVFIPITQQGEMLRFEAGFEFLIPGAWASFGFVADLSTTAVPVTAAPIVRIISTEVLTFNTPYVNTGQAFQVRARVANTSGTILGPLDMVLRSDGNSAFDSLFTVDVIQPDDTAELIFDIIAADQPVVAEIFRVAVASPHVGADDPIDDMATAVIETPAQLVLNYSLVGVENSLVDQDQAFSLIIELVNEGQAATTDGEYLLTTGGIDLGDGYSPTGIISVDQHMELDFQSPSFDTNIILTFTLTSMPIDINTGVRASAGDSSFFIEITVQHFDAELLGRAELPGSNLLLPGQDKELFLLILTNGGTADATAVSLDEMSFTLRGPGDQSLDVSEIIDMGASVFYRNGLPIAADLSGNDRMTAVFEDLIIEAQVTCSLVFVAAIRESNIDQFELLLESRHILATYDRGIQEGETVDVVSESGDGTLLAMTFVVKGSSISESFLVRNNPVDPTKAPVEFSYELTAASDIEFRIFTLTGEEVYARDISSQDNGAGEHVIEWDGLNNDGQVVCNGVYIVSIRVVNTGETARLKLAVVK